MWRERTSRPPKRNAKKGARTISANRAGVQREALEGERDYNPSRLCVRSSLIAKRAVSKLEARRFRAGDDCLLLKDAQFFRRRLENLVPLCHPRLHYLETDLAL